MQGLAPILLLVFMLGTLFGVYIGNKKFQRAVNSLFRNKDDEDEEYDEDGEY